MPGAVRRAGQRVLLVSLDPAHSLGDCLDVRLGPEDRAVPGSRGRLRAAEVDAPRAFGEWMRRHRALLRELGERGTYLRADEVDSFLDLTLPGVDELMGLRELLRLSRARPDHALVVDSAPTGHALRLLDAPAQLRQLARVLDDLQAKHRSLSAALGGGWTPDEADRFIAELEAEADALRSLLERSAFTWVTHPEALAWEETLDGLAALRERGLTRQDLLVNRVTPRPATPCGFCDARVRAESGVLAAIRRQALPRGLAARTDRRSRAARRALAVAPAAGPAPSGACADARSPAPHAGPAGPGWPALPLPPEARGVRRQGRRRQDVRRSGHGARGRGPLVATGPAPFGRPRALARRRAGRSARRGRAGSRDRARAGRVARVRRAPARVSASHRSAARRRTTAARAWPPPSTARSRATCWRKHRPGSTSCSRSWRSRRPWRLSGRTMISWCSTALRPATPCDCWRCRRSPWAGSRRC